MSAEILIVDDNTDIRNIINELIIDAGYKTRIAANYNQALAEIDKKLPDVAILDVKLDKGDNDGIELLSHIKTKNKDVPVIIISGHANIEMAIKSLQHGAFEFIEKPFDQERLLNFVSRAVENYDLKKQNKDYESKLFSSFDLIGDSKNTTNIIEYSEFEKTFEFISTKKPHIIAAVFAFGRETVIPGMFTRLVSQLEFTEINCPKLFYYLARHIEIDGEEHGPASNALVENLCKDDPILIEEAKNAAIAAILSRIKLWDDVASIIQLNEYNQTPDNRVSIAV